MTALVTGGASGIGREVAARLREAGHDVVVWDLAGADIACDVSDPDAVSAVMAQTVRDHGAPTRVVTCAGIGASGLLLEQSPAEWNRVLAVNLTGTWLTIRAAARAMIDAGVGGSVVAVSSISGTLADRDMGAYCVSKAGVDMLVKVAAAEWGGHGIRVNAVGPGVTRTPMLAKPETAARLGGGPVRTDRIGRFGGRRRRGRRDRGRARIALGDRPSRACRRRPGAAQPHRRLRPIAAGDGPKGPQLIPKSMMPRTILPLRRSS